MDTITEPLPDDSPTQAREKPLPRRIADLLIARIFMGELKAGDRLPPDRVLAEQLGVDRTSLRAALNELASRNIVRAVQGSGVVVLDYREYAGLDFLDAVFGMPDIEFGSAFNLELLDHWIDVVPAILKLALRRAKPADLSAMDIIFTRQLDVMKKGANYLELAALEVELQDMIVKLAGSTILRLFANSMRQLRIRFAASFFKTVDVGQHILTMRTLIQLVMAGCTTPDESAMRFKAYLLEHTRAHRSRIAAMPSGPNRRGDRQRSTQLKNAHGGTRQ
jgi:GntR family transcriptional regulator, transcriptional repressor for pyruvate dehydrogenase complex